MKGKALLQHLIEKHGFSPWILRHKVNSTGYKSLVRSHEVEYHGAWVQQQDHSHKQDGK